MLRRKFLALAASGLLGLTVAESMPAAGNSLHIVRDRVGLVFATHHETYISLEGDPAECIRIMRHYQRTLWPEWQTNATAVRIMREAEVSAWETGKCGIWVGDPLCRQAARETLFRFRVRVVERGR